MTDELQQLLERIQKEGVDEAGRQSQALIQAAEARAAVIRSQTEQEATERRATVAREAVAFQRRAEQAVRQAARDVLLQVERDLGALFDRLLRADVDQALAAPDLVATLALEAARAYVSGGEQAVTILVSSRGEELVRALQAQLAVQAQEGVTLESEDASFSGFRLRLAGGRVEHSFTGSAIAAAVGRLLRPQLAALLQPPPEQVN